MEMWPGMQTGLLALDSAQTAVSWCGPLTLRPTNRSDAGEGKRAILVPTKTLMHSVAVVSPTMWH